MLTALLLGVLAAAMSGPAAQAAIDDGAATRTLEALVRCTQELAHEDAA